MTLFSLLAFGLLCGWVIIRADDEGGDADFWSQTKQSEDKLERSAAVIETLDECEKGMITLANLAPTTTGVRALQLHTPQASWTQEDLKWLSPHALEDFEHWGKANTLQRDFEVSEVEFRRILKAVQPYLTETVVRPDVPFLSFGVLREIAGKTLVCEFEAPMKKFDDFYTALVLAIEPEHGEIRQAIRSQAGMITRMGFWGEKRK